jgi:hypothetical protein
MPVLEIRTYRLYPGKRDAFHRLFVDEALPLVREHGMRVVGFGPSRHDDNSYLLLRAFDSVEQRSDQEDAFYGSERWLRDYDDRVMAKIDIYATVVIEVSEVTIASLSADLLQGV